MTILDEVMTCVRAGNRDAALRLVQAWRKEHPERDPFKNLLEPLVVLSGDEWREGKLSLAQAYVASKVAEDTVTLLNSEDEARVAALRGPLKGPIVLGSAEDDFHGLGRRMVASFLRADLWDVHDLGNDVPASELLQAAVELGAKVIGVSAMMYSTAQHVSELRRLLDEQGLSGTIKLAVGGAVFRLRPELVARVGGDGTAPSAMEASALFERLWREAEQGKAI